MYYLHTKLAAGSQWAADTVGSGRLGGDWQATGRRLAGEQKSTRRRLQLAQCAEMNCHCVEIFSNQQQAGRIKRFTPSKAARERDTERERVCRCVCEQSLSECVRVSLWPEGATVVGLRLLLAHFSLLRAEWRTFAACNLWRLHFGL